MTITRRFVLLFALMFWQGGFMFYGAVTVPIMRARLGVGPDRSLITQEVTQWMNLAGTLAILAMFADLWASPLEGKRWRWIAWLAMALPQPIVIFLHRELSRQMAAAGFQSSGLSGFLMWHRAYLSCNAIQWLGGMAFAVLSIRAWRDEDRK
jgi:hypothetical protein